MDAFSGLVIYWVCCLAHVLGPCIVIIHQLDSRSLISINLKVIMHKFYLTLCSPRIHLVLVYTKGFPLI